MATVPSERKGTDPRSGPNRGNEREQVTADQLHQQVLVGHRPVKNTMFVRRADAIILHLREIRQPALTTRLSVHAADKGPCCISLALMQEKVKDLKLSQISWPFPASEIGAKFRVFYLEWIQAHKDTALGLRPKETSHPPKKQSVKYGKQQAVR
ncbi:MAG: hypothetical protein Q9160_007903 [Pyrenula sp. 1 TL-2023]